MPVAPTVHPSLPSHGKTEHGKYGQARNMEHGAQTLLEHGNTDGTRASAHAE
jgi:hypothetical protein